MTVVPILMLQHVLHLGGVGVSFSVHCYIWNAIYITEVSTILHSFPRQITSQSTKASIKQPNVSSKPYPISQTTFFLKIFIWVTGRYHSPYYKTCTSVETCYSFITGLKFKVLSHYIDELQPKIFNISFEAFIIADPFTLNIGLKGS